MMLLRKYKRDVHCNAINNYFSKFHINYFLFYQFILIFICYDDTQFSLKKFIAAAAAAIV